MLTDPPGPFLDKTEHLAKWLFFRELQTCFVYPAPLQPPSPKGVGSQPAMGSTRALHILASRSTLCSVHLSSFALIFFNFVCLVFCQLSPSLHKIKPFLSEPLVPRCSSGNTQPGLAAGLRTAHWTGLCRSADWAGEASLLPSSHHTQHLQGMTNSCEKRTEEGGERQDKHPKS